MMVIIVSGHSCTGKTLMSQTLLEKYKIPYYSIDNIKMGLFRSDPSCGFTPTDSNEHIGEKLWPMLRAIIMTSIENKQDIIIEGCYIMPSYLETLDQPYRDKVIPVFMGFSKDYIKEKFESNILGFRSVVEERMYEEDRPIEDFIESHGRFKEACQIHNTHFFEISKNYEEEVNEVYKYIESERISLCN